MKSLKLLLIGLGLLGLTIPVLAVLPLQSGGVSGTGTTQTPTQTPAQTPTQTPSKPAGAPQNATQNITMQILPNGTINIARNGKQTGTGIPTLQGYTPTSSIGTTLSAAHGQITQNYAANNIAVVYDCVLADPDLTITAHVTNNSKLTIGPLVMVTPAFTFSARPGGTMPTWHSSYLAAEGTIIFHPSSAQPLGCVYASDSVYAVAAWSPSEISRQSLIQGSWVRDGWLPNPLPIELHTVDSVNAGASMDISIAIRITTDQTAPGLMDGYKAILPPMSYTPVNKPATAFQSIDARWVTPADPYGYNGDTRRIDLPQGVRQYLGMVNPILKSSNGIGVIFWAPGGFQTTTMYPIDYDVNLNRIATTWPALVQGLKANGYRAGICARFGDTINPDGTVRRTDPTNPADVTEMLARIDSVTKAGVTMWYIDSVCNDWPSTQMTAIAKKHLPASHLFFTEYASDISLSFAGTYCEWEGTQTHWLTEQQRAQLVELYPNATWLCIDKSNTTSPAQLTALGFQPLTGD